MKTLQKTHFLLIEIKNDFTVSVLFFGVMDFVLAIC